MYVMGILYWSTGKLSIYTKFFKLDNLGHSRYMYTVKPVYNGHPWDQKKVAV
jgi:hypothetical protein